jgi:hypothetical protein
MPFAGSEDARVTAWLAALEERQLADLTLSEVARALRALSSCYVERRARLAGGGALEGTGKRAAFALFYGPVHFFVTRHIVRALSLDRQSVSRIYDLGCGTGAAGAAWALERPAASVVGADRHPWAVAEANWTYRQLGLAGRAAQQDLTKARIAPAAGAGVLAAYSINELSDDLRAVMLHRLIEAHAAGASILIVEPIARRTTPWWSAWEAAFTAAGGRADEWRFPAALPERQRQLAKAAGLNPQELTARTLAIPA